MFYMTVPGRKDSNFVSTPKVHYMLDFRHKVEADNFLEDACKLIRLDWIRLGTYADVEICKNNNKIYPYVHRDHYGLQSIAAHPTISRTYYIFIHLIWTSASAAPKGCIDSNADSWQDFSVQISKHGHFHLNAYSPCSHCLLVVTMYTFN